MKLSKAMRIGFKTTKPRRGIFLSQSQASACPIGAAAKAVGLSPAEWGMDIIPLGTRERFPVLRKKLGQNRFETLPLNAQAMTDRSTSIETVIITLFDNLAWRREKIADILEGWGL